MWQGKKKAHKKRRDLYSWLAKQMSVPLEDCHFGYFTLGQLKQAYRILRQAASQKMKYDNCGNIFFEGERE